MGLFGNKKDDKNELPPLNFPELPNSVPSFEQEKSMKVSDAKEIKEAISNSDVPQMQPVSSDMSEKPLFVKIEKYKDLVNTLGKLKARLNDADHILQNLNDLKEKENRELSAWHSDLEKVRNQLLDIDRKLFE
ncbi:MAG: hypothetical protein ISS01_01320 [Nanoarchaeota archaeon]|nr:hypothetical protein [Nanoarchaeota archaeon]